jgi:hypothetical protein
LGGLLARRQASCPSIPRPIIESVKEFLVIGLNGRACISGEGRLGTSLYHSTAGRRWSSLVATMKIRTGVRGRGSRSNGWRHRENGVGFLGPMGETGVPVRGSTGNSQNHGTSFILLTGGNLVISLKGGITKISEETLLLLLLGIDNKKHILKSYYVFLLEN